MHLILMLALLGILFVGAALGLLCWAERNPPPVSADSGAVIVLGCQVYSTGELSPQLELRLQAALQTYRDHPRLIVCCGGQGKKEPGPEGKVMRDWLIAQGVPEKDVIAECESTDTRQNLFYARRLLPEDIKRVTVITSDYHLPRALLIARDAGLESDGIGSPCLPEAGFWVKNHGRELLAWGKYIMYKLKLLPDP